QAAEAFVGVDRIEQADELGRDGAPQVCMERALGDVAFAVGFAERVAAAIGCEEIENLRAGVVLRRDERAPQELAFAAAGAERAEMIEEEAPAAPARAARDLAAGETVRDRGGEVAAESLACALTGAVESGQYLLGGPDFEQLLAELAEAAFVEHADGFGQPAVDAVEAEDRGHLQICGGGERDVAVHGCAGLHLPRHAADRVTLVEL